MAEKKNPLGPTGKTVAANIARLRTAVGLSYAELSRKLTESGRPIATLGLSRIESGERRVDADDLMAISIVLGVNPNALLLPSPSPIDRPEVNITAQPDYADVARLWLWAEGLTPIHPAISLEEFRRRVNSPNPKNSTPVQSDELSRVVTEVASEVMVRLIENGAPDTLRYFKNYSGSDQKRRADGDD